MLRPKLNIKQTHELESYNKMVLFNQCLAIVTEQASKFKARHKIESALRLEGIHCYWDANKFSFYLSGKSVEIYFYHYGKTANDCASILAIISEDKNRYNYKDKELDNLSPGLYQTRREIESYFEYEMTLNEFELRKQAMIMALNDLINDVKGLKANESNAN